ncbi:MAG: alpha/beta hydrolase, partial [Clostridia bacterium]|nr:alpha/beta hydrolase [Clostridia bacterium]
MKASKSLAVLLAVLMLCGALFCVPASAVSSKPKVPVIYVHGFMGVSLYGGLNTDAPYQIFGPTSDKIKNTVTGALLPATDFLLHADWEKLVDDATPVMQNLLGDSYCDENGDPAPNTGVKWEYPSPEVVRSSVSTEFEYDWRLSPIELGQRLARYIDYVCDCTGSDKVSLICHSYGNCVAMGYVAQYGVGKLDGMVYNASAFLGETYTGELFSGNLVVGGPMFMNFLRSNAFFNNDGGKALCDML